jgi:hypothetical protein
MKKTYNKPTIEAIQLLGQNAIMAGSSRFILGPGNGDAPGGND